MCKSEIERWNIDTLREVLVEHFTNDPVDAVRQLSNDDAVKVAELVLGVSITKVFYESGEPGYQVLI